MVFSQNRGWFADEANRITYLLNLIDPASEGWSRPLLSQWASGNRANPLSSWADLQRSFLTYFDNPIRATKALNNIVNLKQSGSAQQYATKFKEYAQELEWNDAALVGHFSQGHKPEV